MRENIQCANFKFPSLSLMQKSAGHFYENFFIPISEPTNKNILLIFAKKEERNHTNCQPAPMQRQEPIRG